MVKSREVGRLERREGGIRGLDGSVGSIFMRSERSFCEMFVWANFRDFGSMSEFVCTVKTGQRTPFAS